MADEDFFLAVKQRMNGVVLNAEMHETLPYVAQLLFNNNANAIVIREGGIPKGIVTSKDILKALLSFEKEPEDIAASEFMTSPLITIDHDKDITEARNMMLDHSIQKLPVVQDLEVIGLMVQTDLIKDTSWYKRI